MQFAAQYDGTEYWPATRPVKQLFVLLHGVGGQPDDMLPLVHLLRKAFPESGIFVPEGFARFEGGGSGRQWFSLQNITEAERVSRVAAVMPALHELVHYAQQRFNVLQSDTALFGFSQGAIMALEYCVKHDGGVGRVVAFSGRFASLPESVPELTTLHILHGEQDTVITVHHAYAGYECLMQLGGDATLDVASGVGHELHPAIAARAIKLLQTIIPQRSWKLAMQNL